MGNDYKTIGSSADVENINPNTQNAWNAFYQMMPAAQAGMGDVVAGLAGVDHDPNAWFNQWQSQMPYMQQITQMATEPYRQGMNNYADVAANQARRNIEQNYGGGGLYSGAFGKAVGEGMSAPYFQAAANTEGLQANLLQALAGQGMGINSQNQQTATNAQLQALAEQGNLWGNQMNMAGAGMAQLGAPEWWQPTWVEDTPVWQQALGGAVSGGLTGLMTGNPLGGILGALGGGASGALGMGGAGAGYSAANLFGPEGKWGDVTLQSLFGGNNQPPVPNVPPMSMYQANLGNLGYQYPSMGSGYPPTPITMDNSLMSLYYGL